MWSTGTSTSRPSAASGWSWSGPTARASPRSSRSWPESIPIQGGRPGARQQRRAGVLLAQNRLENLDPKRTVMEEAMEMRNVNRDVTEQMARTILGGFLFRKDDVFKKVSVLSGGEKSRLALAQLLLAPPNLLLMDEPTTHLDIPSIDALVERPQGLRGHARLHQPRRLLHPRAGPERPARPFRAPDAVRGGLRLLPGQVQGDQRARGADGGLHGRPAGAGPGRRPRAGRPGGRSPRTRSARRPRSGRRAPPQRKSCGRRSASSSSASPSWRRSRTSSPPSSRRRRPTRSRGRPSTSTGS